MAEDVICIVMRAPDPARTKTRLAPIPPELRMALATAMLEDVLEVAAQVPGARRVLACDPGPEHPFFVEMAGRFGAERVPQGVGDLGARLTALSAQLTPGARGLLLLGGDCPHLTAAELGRALAALDHADAAMIPAEDGGYVALATRGHLPALFNEVPWSSPAVSRVTLERAAAAGLNVQTLPGSFDVDQPQDLARLAANIPAHLAPRTRRILMRCALYTQAAPT